MKPCKVCIQPQFCDCLCATCESSRADFRAAFNNSGRDLKDYESFVVIAPTGIIQVLASSKEGALNYAKNVYSVRPGYCVVLTAKEYEAREAKRLENS